MLLALQEAAGADVYQHMLVQTGLQAQYGASLPPADLYPALDFADVARLNLALEEAFGARGGRSIALRAGTSFFEHGLKGVGVLRGVTTGQFKALPTPARAEIALMGMAAVFSQYSDQTTTLHKQEKTYRLVVTHSPFAWGRVSSTPVCHLLVGAIKACLRWATDGYEFIVHEQTCRATGAGECVFIVNSQPIGKV
ncbi:MAG: 4-vinyl reductase [Chloroflexota bacterium]